VSEAPGSPGPSESPEPPVPDEQRRTWRILGSWPDRLEVLLPLLAYAVIALASLSTSSLGLLSVGGGGVGA
jgi:hypothetical protein